MIRVITENIFWRTHGVLIARLIMGGVFLMASYMKFHDIDSTILYITSVGLPLAKLLAWLAAIFELVLGLCIVVGVFFRGASLLLGAYAIFLAFTFHGPSLWTGNPNEFGFFIDHFVMLAGFLYMAAHGPGKTWTLKNIGINLD